MNLINHLMRNWLSISIIQLLAWALIFNLGSCSCGDTEGESNSKIGMRVAKDHITGKNKAEVIITNDGDKESTELDLAKYRLQATILEQQGGTGSQLSYTKEGNSQEIPATEINETLDKFKGSSTLQGQTNKTIEIGVVPGLNVNKVKFKIALLKADDSSVLASQEVTWTVAAAPQLLLTDIKPAIGTKAGVFYLQVNQADIQPSQIQVSFTVNPNTASCKFGGKETKHITNLADLLGHDNPIPANTKTDLIDFQLLTATADVAAIIISMKKDGQELLDTASNQVNWRRKDLTFTLETEQTGSQVTCKVIKQGADAIDDLTDKIELKIKPKETNTAKLKETITKTEFPPNENIGLKNANFPNPDQTATIKLDADLKTEVSATFEFDLLYNGVSVLTAKKSATFTIPLDIVNIKKAADNTITYELQNTGSVEAKTVTLEYEAVNKNAKIATQSNNKINIPDIAAAPIGGSTKVTGNLGDLTFEPGQSSAAFKFTLKAGGKVITEKTEVFANKDIQLVLELPTAPKKYDPKTRVVKVIVKNTGAGTIEKEDHLKLSYVLDNGALINSTTKGEIAIDNLAAATGSWTHDLQVDLNDKSSAKLRLSLQLNGQELPTTVQEVTCQEDVNIAFDPAPTNITDGKLDIPLRVKNDGQSTISTKYLKLRVTQNAGGSMCRINNYDLNSSGTIDIPATSTNQDILNSSSINLSLTLDSQENRKTSFTFQLVYKDSPIVGTKNVSWQISDPQFEISDVAAKSIDEQEGRLTFKLTNKSTRGLDKYDLENTCLHINPVADQNVYYDNKSQILNNTTLEHLGVRLLQPNETQNITLGLTRTTNVDKDFQNIQVIDKTTPLTTYSTPLNVPWPAFPIASLQFEDGATPLNLRGDKEIKLKIENIGTEPADYSNIRIHITNNSGGPISINSNDIQNSATGQELAATTLVNTLRTEVSLGKNTSKELQLTLDPKANKEVSLSFQLKYQAKGHTLWKQHGGAKQVTWKCAPQFTMEFTDLKTAKNNAKKGEVKLKLTNTCGRVLDAEDLQKTTFKFKAGPADNPIEVLYNTQSAEGKHLDELGFHINNLNDSINSNASTIQLTLERDKNQSSWSKDNELVFDSKSVSNKVDVLEWKPLPIVKLTSRNTDYGTGVNKMELILESKADLAEDQLKTAKITVTVVKKGSLNQGANGKFKVGTITDIHNKTLQEVFGINASPLAKNKPLGTELTFDSFTEACDVTIALEGLPDEFEGEALTITKQP